MQNKIFASVVFTAATLYLFLSHSFVRSLINLTLTALIAVPFASGVRLPSLPPLPLHIAHDFIQLIQQQLEQPRIATLMAIWLVLQLGMLACGVLPDWLLIVGLGNGLIWGDMDLVVGWVSDTVGKAEAAIPRACD